MTHEYPEVPTRCFYCDAERPPPNQGGSRWTEHRWCCRCVYTVCCPECCKQGLDVTSRCPACGDDWEYT